MIEALRLNRLSAYSSINKLLVFCPHADIRHAFAVLRRKDLTQLENILTFERQHDQLIIERH